MDHKTLRLYQGRKEGGGGNVCLKKNNKKKKRNKYRSFRKKVMRNGDVIQW